MSTRIDVGRGRGRGLRDAMSDVVYVWEAAERGETSVPLSRVVFIGEAAYRAVLAPKRVETMRHLRAYREPGVRALAVALGRDASTVHGDLAALLEHDLATKADDGSLFSDVDDVSANIRVAERVRAGLRGRVTGATSLTTPCAAGARRGAA